MVQLVGYCTRDVHQEDVGSILLAFLLKERENLEQGQARALVRRTRERIYEKNRLA